MSTKFSYNAIIDFDIAANAYLKRHTDRNGKVKDSRFTYALQRVTAQLPKTHDKYQRLLRGIEREHALTVDGKADGELLRGPDVQTPQGPVPGHYRFSRDGQEKADNAKDALLEGKEEKHKFEVDPHITTALPEDLSLREIEVFEGFVLSSAQCNELREKLEAVSDPKPTGGSEPAIGGQV